MIKRCITRFIGIVSAIWFVLFGKVSWAMPPWLHYTMAQAKNHPRAFYTKCGVMAGLLIIIMSGVYWVLSMPVPLKLEAMITAPKLTPNEKVLVPDTLHIDFGLVSQGTFYPKSVAPLNAVGKEITQGISTTPVLHGKWVWQSDSQLIFTPAQDWPAGQTVNIHFNQSLFTSGVQLDSLNASFTTLPFTFAITNYRFYQDPIRPEVRQAVAAIQFSYPVDADSLDNHLLLRWQSLVSDKAKSPSFRYTLSYDDNKRIAYLHSESLPLPVNARFLELTITKGVKALMGSSVTEQDVKSTVLIPDAGSYFKVSNATASIIRNEKNVPEQVITLETTLGVKSEVLNKSLHVYLLPKDYPKTTYEEAKLNYEWKDPGEVTPAILALATPIELQAIPPEREYAVLHSYIVKLDTPSYLYIKLDKGATSFGHFTLLNDYTALFKTPVYPQEISFLHKGSLLALGTDEKLSMSVRGLRAVKFDIAKVLPEDINHLITQTRGDFSDPSFIDANFNKQNISEITSEIQLFDQTNPGKAQYTALDLSRYLNQKVKTNRPLGLFLLQAQGWDVDKKIPLGGRTNRLILITDLGLVVKDNQDGSHDIFVQSVTKGLPVNHAQISLLGKNGLPVSFGSTDDKGHLHFPSFIDFTNEREPSVYLVQNGSDVSFIPFYRPDRLLNYSRFDVGGVMSDMNHAGLSAYIFTDRGIFRPGDVVHIGMIVKQPFVKPLLMAIPLEVMIVDPRGTTVKDEKITLDANGYLSLDFQTNETSATGQYSIQLYIVKDKHASNLIGSTAIHVDEFLPDRLRISAALAQIEMGWAYPSQLMAHVNLWNLYGAPAVKHRISGKILLTPERVTFKNYPDYFFFDPLLNPRSPPKVFTDNLGDTETNDQGQATLDLKLDRFEKATYKLTLYVEGFEAEGGRSVSTELSTLVSPLTQFVGYKPDGDLNYIKQHSIRRVHIISINPKLKQQSLSQLQINLFKQHPINTLTKKEDGTYQYQSIMQTDSLNHHSFAIPDQGVDYALDTENVGHFLVTVTDAAGTVLSQFNYDVVGNDQLVLPKNAELNVKLNKSIFAAGEDIEMQIVSPYIGAGLITIERDKVYAYQWFKTTTTASLQKIQLPADFQGDGYVNITFVRDINSPDIFMSPLSIYAAPFSVTHKQQDIKVNLSVASNALPAKPLTITYQTDRPSKIIVFAVDEGILQVSKYESPDPLAFFFQKHALEVNTQQILDLILPKFMAERELSQVGGDAGGALLRKNLNPFKRKTDAPVVYWSSILSADAVPKELTYDVPAYFNGSLRVMAVAVSADAVGARSVSTEIRGYFVLNPNVPTFVAPGDQFEVTMSIANNVKGSGPQASVTVQINPSSSLQLMGDAQQILVIPEGEERSVRYTLQAKSILGSAAIDFQAKQNDKVSLLSQTISVRPAVPYAAYMNSGYSSMAVQSLPVAHSLYSAFRRVEAALSLDPLMLVSGLQQWLDDYPYGCTEQLVSKGFPYLVMANQVGFEKDAGHFQNKVTKTIEMIMQRQMSNGGFNYWPETGTTYSNDFASVYAMHFLTEAKAQKYDIPDRVFSLGLQYLKELASRDITSFEDARIKAYAIYLITRNEIVSTAYLTHLQAWLELNTSNNWRQDITGVYIASTYQLLKSTEEANRLIRDYQFNATKVNGVTDFYNQALGNAQYVYLLAKHFPERLQNKDISLVMSLVETLNNDSLSTLLSAYTTLALSTYQASNQSDAVNPLSISTLLYNGQTRVLSSSNGLYQKASINPDVKAVIFNNKVKQTYFYQLLQAGFEKQLPKEAIKNGIEVSRELRNADNQAVNTASLGDELTVHLRARSIDDQQHDNIALIDLLPGGFEVVRDSVKTDGVDYVDIREDRVLFFLSLLPESKEIIYRIKAVNLGKFTLPPVFATSMYHPTIKSMGVASDITVHNEALK